MSHIYKCDVCGVEGVYDVLMASIPAEKDGVVKTIHAMGMQDQTHICDFCEEKLHVKYTSFIDSLETETEKMFFGRFGLFKEDK